MGVTKKPLRAGSGSKRWEGEPRTYTNYGRAVGSKTTIISQLIKLNLKLKRFVESGKASTDDARWAYRVSDLLDQALMADQPREAE